MSKELYFVDNEEENQTNTNADENISDPSLETSTETSQNELFTSPLSNEPDWVQIDKQLEHLIKRVIEALLFTTSDPLPLAKIREITDTIHPLRPKQLRHLLEELKQEYIAGQRAFKLEEIAEGYVLRTFEEYAPYLELLHRQRRGEKLSPASTEVLAIIAFRQPITRPQIDAIRGVDSSGTVMQLIERQLIESLGKLEAPGRPTLYGTTKNFLKHFGLKNLNQINQNLS